MSEGGGREGGHVVRDWPGQGGVSSRRSSGSCLDVLIPVFCGLFNPHPRAGRTTLSPRKSVPVKTEQSEVPYPILVVTPRPQRPRRVTTLLQ